MLIPHRALAALTALSLATAVYAAPAANAPRDVVAAQRALSVAVSQGTLLDILAARARFAARATTAPKSAWAHYWVAVCDWRATPRFEGKSKATAVRTCDEGLAEIDKAIALAPEEGEFHAARASLLGMSLQFRPSEMMTVMTASIPTKAAIASASCTGSRPWATPWHSMAAVPSRATNPARAMACWTARNGN